MMVTMVTDQLLQQTIDATNDNSQVRIIVTFEIYCRCPALPCLAGLCRDCVGGWVQ